MHGRPTVFLYVDNFSRFHIDSVELKSGMTMLLADVPVIDRLHATVIAINHILQVFRHNETIKSRGMAWDDEFLSLALKAFRL